MNNSGRFQKMNLIGRKPLKTKVLHALWDYCRYGVTLALIWPYHNFLNALEGRGGVPPPPPMHPYSGLNAHTRHTLIRIPEPRTRLALHWRSLRPVRWWLGVGGVQAAICYGWLALPALLSG